MKNKGVTHQLAVAFLFLMVKASFAAEDTPQKIDLGKLYQRYVKADYSTLALPEFDKRVSFTSVAIELSQGFRRGSDSARGGGFLKAGAVGSNKVIARLVARDGANAEKMKALSSGDQFKATCTVAIASDADFIPLVGCVFD